MKWPHWFGSGQAISAAEGEIKALTDQFHITLRAHFARMPALDGKLAPEILKRLKDILQAERPRSWSEAYEIEQLLVHLYDDDTLRTELSVRGLEARTTLRPPLAEIYTGQIQQATAPEQQRGVLARLVNDLQWRYTVNEVKRRYAQDITSRTGWLFAGALILFAAWTAYIVLSDAASGDLHLLVFAAFAATWGATFSMLGSLKSRLDASELDDLKLMRPWVMLLSRALIGTGAGCVLYFLLRSGLLGGGAFPDLTTLDATPVTRKGLAMLIIWCFIAGFSEKLVPSILERTEGRAGSPATVDSDRFRPGSNGAGVRVEATNGSESVTQPHRGSTNAASGSALAGNADGSSPQR